MAQKNLTRLNVALTATTGAFARSMKGAVGMASQFGDGLKRAILGPLGLITGALTGGGFIAGIKSASLRIDELSKAATRLGITTESLAGLRLAAERGNASAEELSSGMSRLTKVVEEAAQGSKAAKASIAQLGIPLSELVALRTDEQFKRVADAITAMGTQGQKTAAIMDIFGKGGMGLALTMATGSKGMNQATEEAKKLGLAVDGVSAAKIEATNEAFERIGLVVQGVFNNIAIKISSFVEAVSLAFTNASIDANGFADTIDNVMAFAMKAGGFIADAWQGLNIVWLATKQGLYQVGTGFMFVGEIAVHAAQWLGSKFSAAFDLIEAAWDVLYNVLLVGWGGLKVAITAFVEFTGKQFSSLMRIALEVAGVFSNEMANSIAIAAAKIDRSVEAMAANAKAELDKTVGELGAASSEVVAKTDALFASVETTGSQSLRDLGKAFWELSKEAGEALSLGLGEEQSSLRFQRILSEVQNEAQVRAEGRAAELEAERLAQDAARAAQAEHLSQRESLWDQSWAYEQSQREKNAALALSSASSTFGNLAKLQESHSKVAQRIGKAAAKVKIVSDTASAAMGAYSALAGIPIVGPALGIAAAAAAVAAGAIQLGNVDKNGIGGSGAGPADVSTTNIGGIQAPARASQTLVLQGDSFSAESLTKIFSDAKERGYVIEGVRRG